MKKKQIAILCDFLDDSRFGGATYTYFLVKNIIHLKSTWQDKFDIWFVHKKPNNMLLGEKNIIIPRDVFGTSSLGLAVAYIWDIFRRAIIIPLMLHFKGINLVHDLSFFNFYCFDLLGFLYKKVWTVYDLIPIRKPEFCTGNLRLFKMMFTLFIKPSLLLANRIIAISTFTKEDVINYFPFIKNKSISITHMGIETMSFDETYKSKYIQPGSQFFMTVGNIEPRRNIEVMLDAFVGVLKTKPDLIFFVIGNTSSEYAKSLIENYKEIKQVVFTGSISDQELYFMYKHATLYLYMSLFEGFGLGVLEAMYYGCPVIVSNLTSLPEVVGDGGIVVHYDDASGLKDNILKLLDDTIYRNNYSLYCKERAQKFTWDSCAEKTIDIYKDMLLDKKNI